MLIIFGIIFPSIFLVMAIPAYLKTHDYNLFLGFAPFFLLCLWALGFRLKMDGEKLIYSTWFKKQEILLKNIDRYKIESGYKRWEDYRKPHDRMILWSKHNRNPEMVINLRIFSNEDCGRLTDILKRIIAENKEEQSLKTM